MAVELALAQSPGPGRSSSPTWPAVKTDVNVKTLIGKGSGETFQLAFSGSGWLLLQPSEGSAATPAGGRDRRRDRRPARRAVARRKLGRASLAPRVPPISRPFPRSIADASQEGRPYGRWEERLRETFAAECESLAAEAGAALDPMTVKWFPDRTWGGRVYVPATGRAAEPTTGEDGEAVLAEYYGWVSFDPGAEEDGPADLRARVDFTDVTAEENPDWKIDLNDDVIGSWRTDRGRGGDVTLIWGLPLVRGAVAATAELDGDTLDQTPVADGRFTLVGVDAVTGFGDDLFLEIKLWDRSVRQIASESLYAEAEPVGEPESGD